MERDEFSRKHPQNILDATLVCLKNEDKNRAYNLKKEKRKTEQHWHWAHSNSKTPCSDNLKAKFSHLSYATLFPIAAACRNTNLDTAEILIYSCHAFQMAASRSHETQRSNMNDSLIAPAIGEVPAAHHARRSAPHSPWKSRSTVEPSCFTEGSAERVTMTCKFLGCLQGQKRGWKSQLPTMHVMSLHWGACGEIRHVHLSCKLTPKQRNSLGCEEIAHCFQTATKPPIQCTVLMSPCLEWLQHNGILA